MIEAANNQSHRSSKKKKKRKNLFQQKYNPEISRKILQAGKVILKLAKVFFFSPTTSPVKKFLPRSRAFAEPFEVKIAKYQVLLRKSKTQIALVEGVLSFMHAKKVSNCASKNCLVFPGY